MPTPDWQQWLIDLVLFAMVAAWLALSAHAFRVRAARRWIPGALFALGYLASVACGAGNNLLGDAYRDYVHQLKHPAPPAYFDETWGKDLPSEDRHRFSEMLARNSYQAWGIHVKYFGLSGNMIMFEPTNDDRRIFQRREALIEGAQATSRLLAIWVGLWLVLPLFGLALSFLIPVRKLPQPYGRGRRSAAEPLAPLT